MGRTSPLAVTHSTEEGVTRMSCQVIVRKGPMILKLADVEEHQVPDVLDQIDAEFSNHTGITVSIIQSGWTR